MDEKEIKKLTEGHTADFSPEEIEKQQLWALHAETLKKYVEENEYSVNENGEPTLSVLPEPVDFMTPEEQHDLLHLFLQARMLRESGGT